MRGMRRAAFHNLGCKVNSYETEAMMEQLRENGYEIVPFESEADVYIINTCSVTNIADRKSRQMLHRAKKQNPGAVVVAVGCYVQAAGEDILKDASVDIAIGNDKKSLLCQVLDEYFSGRRECFLADNIGNSCVYEDMRINGTGSRTRAVIKVQDGCNQFCSYCIIPFTRGRVRSREGRDVCREAVSLAQNGVREVVITGIHLSSYGLDEQKKSTDYMEDFNADALMRLLEDVSEIDGIQRIRLGSLEPRIITEETAARMASMKKLCPHFHLSLQSGCDSVLKRMNRHYTAAQYEEKCRILRRFFENPAITTDVIVGFPQETDGEFVQTEEFLKKCRLYEMHIFKYSARKNTAASRMSGQVSDDIKARRSAALLELASGLSLEYRREMLAKTAEVLWEEKTVIGGKEYWTGYTREYVRAACACEEDLTGRVSLVRLDKMLTDDVVLCEPCLF